MPRKIQNTTKADLINVSLPNHAATYTVISHQFVIDYAQQALVNAGFGIVDEEYRCTADGQIAQGIYKLNFNNDPELSMMFAWTNSYNKQVKFKCVVGAYLNNSESVMISGEVGSWVRKHMGTADIETKNTIDTYVNNAHMYYNQLCYDKSVMQGLSLNRRRQSQLLGVLFAEYGILTTEQASTVRDLMKTPPMLFTNDNSMWAFYNYVTIALQSSHPKTWMEDQRVLHYFISTICDFKKPVEENVIETSEVVEDQLLNNYGQPENQTNLLVQIAEETGDESVLLPSEPNPIVQAMLNAPEIDINQIDMSKVTMYELTEDGKFVEVQHPVTPEDTFQAVQKEVENKEVLQQSEEMVEEVIEIKELPLDLDAEDDAILDNLLKPINTVVFTDPSGNTFEAPIVSEVFEPEVNLESLNTKSLNTEESFDLDLSFDETESGVEDNTPDFF